MAGLGLFVRTTDGKVHSLDLDPAATLGDLKEALVTICERYRYQKLLYGGVELPGDMEMPLSDTGISNEAVIDCGDVPPLRFSPWFRTDSQLGADAEMTSLSEGSGLVVIGTEQSGALLQPFAGPNDNVNVRVKLTGEARARISIANALPFWRGGISNFKQLHDAMLEQASALYWDLDGGQVHDSGALSGLGSLPSFDGGIVSISASPSAGKIEFGVKEDTGLEELVVDKEPGQKMGLKWSLDCQLKEVKPRSPAALADAVRMIGRRCVAVCGARVDGVQDITRIAGPLARVRFTFTAIAKRPVSVRRREPVASTITVPWVQRGPYVVAVTLQPGCGAAIL
eukprot:TRINITY_DN39924_c0_g1_i1.p1 TRINITY_DN39924_c0_g1~~TRINITY_DN39924_c0_g1_i1.p1  ORF type:complete len:363 (+),score=100.11 TRINITY_DN39924_c0_g1_i1:68-1090(+)